MVTLTLFPGFARTANPPGETVYLGSKRVYWSGIGTVYLETLNADDNLVLSGPGGVFNHTFSPGCGPFQPAGFDITYIFVSGANDISATVKDLCGGNIGVWDIKITGDISFTTPANVISATLTVDINDCVAPCTVNGTVSWTNNGGSSGTLDPAILVNTIPTSLGPAVTINPGETLPYIFQLPGLPAGIYVVEASPNAGTVPQTITVRTPANIVATTIVPSITTCTAPCDLTVDITWVNNGQMTGTFTPTIIVNGVSTPLIPENLSPGLSTTKTFPLIGLTARTYDICADPNTLPCATVTVERVAAAGGGAGMLLGIVGIVALGVMMTSKPKESLRVKPGRVEFKV